MIQAARQLESRLTLIQQEPFVRCLSHRLSDLSASPVNSIITSREGGVVLSTSVCIDEGETAMKTMTCCILVLALVLTLAGTSYANPSCDMKPSPLFKASLQATIAKLEGKVEAVARHATQRPGCVQPNVAPTVEGDQTCYPECGGDPPGSPYYCNTYQPIPTCSPVTGSLSASAFVRTDRLPH